MEQKMDLVLVSPGNKRRIYGRLNSLFTAIEPPLLAGLIAAFIRERGFSVRIIDATAENLSSEKTADRIAEYDPLLVGIIVSGTNPSASTMNMFGASAILKVLKKGSSHTKTLLSGLHPSALPERTLQEEPVDFVCQGEGFYTILKLLETLKSGRKTEDYKINGLWYIKNGKVISNPREKLIENLDELPFAAWNLLPMDRYRAHNWHCFQNITHRQPYAVIYTSLGCPFSCSFCCVNSIFGGPGVRYRSPKRVIDEIGLLTEDYRVRNIKILDETFVLNKAHVLEICDLIIQHGYNLNIWAYARIDTIDKEMLERMKQAGFNWLAFGIEAGNQKVRYGAGKSGFDRDAIYKSIKMTRDAGIFVACNYVFGLPGDNFDTMRETMELAVELNCEYSNFYVAMAYPGSHLYENALRQGMKLPDSWLGYSQYSEETFPLSTEYLSSADILRFRDKAFVEYFSRPEYINMLKKKFGPATVAHVREMLKIKIKRKFAAPAIIEGKNKWPGV